MRLLIYKLVFIALIAFIFIGEGVSYAQNQMPSFSDLSGQELFIEHRCVRCHTIGRGRFVGPDLSEAESKYSKEEIIAWIENPQQIYQKTGEMPYNEGYPPMPPMNVPPAQASAIADYIMSFKAPVTPAAKGTIAGQVVNKTTDVPASGIDLVLTSYMGERPTDEKTIKSDNQGNFSFGNLSWGRSYSITVNFMGTEYSTDKMVFNPGEDTRSLNLPIYEPTVEEDDIAVVEAHMIVQVMEGVLSVANVSLFSNSGDKIYVGGKDTQDGKKESLRISIPKGARDLNFIHGVKPENLVQTDYGVAETASILPGENRVVYTYSVPLGSGSTKLDQIIDYPTKSFLLLVSDTGEATTVSGLTGGEQVDVQGQQFLRWSGADLMPGEKVQIRIHSEFLKEDYLKYGALILLLVLIVAGVIYSSLTRKNPDVEPSSGVEDMKEKRETLIREIATLDDDFEAGKVDEKTYRNVRESKIVELKKVIRRL